MIAAIADTAVILIAAGAWAVVTLVLIERLAGTVPKEPK